MPRPVKCRKVCHFPNVLEFLPADDTDKKTPIVLTVDEYETIRLLDKKGYSQEQCAVSMQIARFVNEIGTGPIGSENGARIQITAVITPMTAIWVMLNFFSVSIVLLLT